MNSKIGLPRSTASCIRNIAIHHHAHPEFWRDIHSQSSEMIQRQLTKIKGISVVDVQRLLIMALQRPDIFPENDPELRTAMQELYRLSGSEHEITHQMAVISHEWAPYRSFAVRYLWKWLYSRG